MSEQAADGPGPKPRVYIDNNIIGLVADGSIRLPTDRVDYLFSSEHLTEIGRSPDPSLLLDTLQGIGAQELSVDLGDGSEIMDSARVTPVPDVHARFREHTDLMSRGSGHIDLFQQFIARGWGADNEATLLDGIGALPSSIAELVGDDEALKERVNSVAEALLKQVQEIGPASAEQFRKATGLRPAVVSNYGPAEAVDRIWNHLKAHLPEAAKDVLFGTSPPDGRAHWPKYLAILTCYGTLNTLGYRPDDRRHRLSGTRRAMSDGVHLANSYFCHALLTHDGPFAAKARAVFSYLQIGTEVCELRRARS